jgi:hypothetical protein
LGDSSIEFFSKAGILRRLKHSISHDISHLSAHELEDLANSVAQNEEAAMALKERDTPVSIHHLPPQLLPADEKLGCHATVHPIGGGGRIPP